MDFFYTFYSIFVFFIFTLCKGNVFVSVLRCVTKFLLPLHI